METTPNIITMPEGVNPAKSDEARGSGGPVKVDTVSTGRDGWTMSVEVDNSVADLQVFENLEDKSFLVKVTSVRARQLADLSEKEGITNPAEMVIKLLEGHFRSIENAPTSIIPTKFNPDHSCKGWILTFVEDDSVSDLVITESIKDKAFIVTAPPAIAEVLRAGALEEGLENPAALVVEMMRRRLDTYEAPINEEFVTELAAIMHAKADRPSAIARYKKATAVTKLDMVSLMRVGLGRVLDEIETNGSLALGKWMDPVLLPKTQRRALQLDRTLSLVGEHGFAEASVSNALDDLIEGRSSDLTDGWDLEPGLYERFSNLVNEWRSEDELPPIVVSRLGWPSAVEEGRAA